MNRNDLQAMLHYTNEVAKIIYASEECRHGDCDKCGYYVICQMNELSHSLIEREANKYDVKGELKDDTK